MDLRIIDNNDFIQLAELTVEMYASVDSAINSFQAVNTLMHFINSGNDFTAVGLYEDNILMGFSSGHAINDVFYFNGLYVSIKNSEWTQKLIDYSLDLVKTKGYKAWEVDATNENIASIMEKYGAKPRYTRYRKEIE